MADSRPVRRKNYSKSKQKTASTAVAEQAGFSTSFIGILIALLIGLLTRSWVSPEKIRTGIEKAASKVHSEARFHIGSARLSLADGIFPELAVVVEDITVENNNPCYFSPLATLNKIKLPLSFAYLVQGKIFIHKVLIDQFDLNMRADRTECGKEKTARSNQEEFEGGYREIVKEPTREALKASAKDRVLASAEAIKEAAQSGTVAKAEEKSKVGAGASDTAMQFPVIKRDNPIDTVEINDLRIHYEPLPFTTLQFSDLNIRLSSSDPREIVTKGIIKLGGETLSGDYSSRANMEILYKESAEPMLSLKIHGTWREGHYGLDAFYQRSKNSLALSSDIRHIPLSQIFPLLKKYGLMTSDFNGRQTWVSGSLSTEVNLENWQKSQVIVENPRIEGEFGEVSAEHLRLLSLEPVSIEPAFVSIKAFDLDKFLIFLNRQHPSPALGKLGVFNGTAKFFSPEDIEIDGEHSGLEFVFSNRGIREVQPIGLIVASFKLFKGFWNINFHKVRPVEGVFDGKIQLRADQNWRAIQIQTRIDELTLSPKIQSLMTAGGQIGSLFGDLQLDLEKGELKTLKGALKFTDISVEGIGLTRPSLLISTQKENVLVALAAKEMTLRTDSPAARELGPIIPEALKSLEKITVRLPQVSLSTNQLQTMEWLNLQAKMDNYKMVSTGGWDREGNLHGQIQMTGAENKLWMIKGVRDQYRLVESK